MNGFAERHDGLSRKLVGCLRVGNTYKLEYLATLIGWQSQAAKGKGVLAPKNQDAQILLMHLEKDRYSTETYTDHLYGTTLFWSGQNSIKTTEKALIDGSKDTFVFIQQRRKQPYFYYGRAIPIRMQINWELGTPSRIVFDLVEYASLCKRRGIEDVHTLPLNYFLEHPFSYDEETAKVPLRTESDVFTSVRNAQTLYRQEAIAYWNGRCAVTGVDNVDWLIASHIKPWRESTNAERVDPHNSLLLTPNYDKLFDKGVISFSPDDGRIILPETQSQKMWKNLNKMNIDDSKCLRHMDDKVAEYLEYHNQYIYRFESGIYGSTEELIDGIIAKSFS